MKKIGKLTSILSIVVLAMAFLTVSGDFGTESGPVNVPFSTNTELESKY